MKTSTIIALALTLMLWSTTSALADNDLIGGIVTGCETELTTYCKDVTPGQKRGLACLYAHGDKLSAKCEYALYDAAVQLERAIAALTYVVNECADDLTTHCAGVQAGEGRLLACLQQNEAAVSSRCKEAVAEVGLR